MKITALDISKGALGLYSRNNKHAAALVHGSIFNLPFADGTLDGVYNLGVMEHFTYSEIDRILHEFHRVLKPHGKLVLFWPHAHATSVIVLGVCHRFLHGILRKNTRLHPPEISLLRSQTRIRETLAQAGFKLSDYRFGPSDFWVQAVVTATLSPQ